MGEVKQTSQESTSKARARVGRHNKAKSDAGASNASGRKLTKYREAKRTRGSPDLTFQKTSNT